MDTLIAERLNLTRARVFYIRQCFSNKSFRKTQNARNRARWNSNISYRIAKLIAHRIRFSLRKQHVRKLSQAIDYVGCSLAELKSYIESKFEPGMTWDNNGTRGWHLDHNKPCAAFDLTKSNEVMECFHFSNLQPLWASKNVRKSSTWNGRHWRHGSV